MSNTNGETPIQQFEGLVHANLNEMKYKHADVDKLTAEIVEFANQLLTKARQNELVVTCIAGMPGLTPEQQAYIEKRLTTLEEEK